MKNIKIYLIKGSKELKLSFSLKNKRKYKNYYDSKVDLETEYIPLEDYGIIKLYNKGQLIKTIYPFYPCVNKSSKNINRFIINGISFSILSHTDALHYELIKFCDVIGIDILIIFCDFDKYNLKGYYSFLNKTLKCNILLLNIIDNKIIQSAKKIKKKTYLLEDKTTNFYVNSDLYNLIWKKIK